MRARSIVMGLVVGASMLVGSPATAAPNDPGFRDQWGLTKTRVTEAWTVTRGAPRVIVAVLDTGVSPVADLTGRLLPGRDFVNNDTNAADDNGHGTMAAGVIAAAGNDRRGVAGVCWNCRILPVKVLDAKGSGGYDRIAAGMRWAADRGAAVISLSLGGSVDSPILRDAVTYATAKGALVVAAAGNSGSSAPHYPGALPGVLAVGGVTATGARYPWSNFGSWVDLTGPGCNRAQTRTGALGDYCGTSSATPFVAGVAGLLASTAPAPTAAQIRTALVATRVRKSGLVDARAALRALPYADNTPPTIKLFGNRRSVTAKAFDSSGVVVRLELVVNGRVTARHNGSLRQFKVPAGAKRVLVRAYDRAGNVRTVNGKLGG